MSDVTPNTTDDQGNLRVLLGVLAGVVVLAGLWFFLISPLLVGDDGVAPDVTATEPGTTADPDVESPVDEDTDVGAVVALPIETYEVFLSRDPFEPVIPRPTAGGADGGGTDGGGTDGGGTDGGGTDGGGTDGGGTDGGGTPGVVTDADVVDVFVDDTGRARALIRVGDLLYTVGEGDVFDDGFLVVTITDACVTLRQDGQTFTLCEDGTSGPGGSPGGGSGDDDACTRGDEVVCDGLVVTVVDVFVDENGVPAAMVQVDTTIYEVRVGDQFAGRFEVLAIDATCVTMRYVDETFTQCEGERTLK